MSKDEAKTLIERFAAFGIKVGNFWGKNKTVVGVKIAAKDCEQALKSLDNAVVGAVKAFMLVNTDLEVADVQEALQGVETAEDALSALVRLVASGALNEVVKG
jgi:hypothetical protein